MRSPSGTAVSRTRGVPPVASRHDVGVEQVYDGVGRVEHLDPVPPRRLHGREPAGPGKHGHAFAQ